jgi:hypothetical protein
MRKLTAAVCAVAVAALVSVTVALADGSENLAPPPITVASGSGIATAGVGTIFTQPGTMTLTLPAGATAKQVLLYWGGHTTGTGGDNTILVSINGGPTTLVTAVGGLGGFPGAIGGPTRFFDFPGVSGTYYSTYRSDITSLGSWHAGANTIVVSGLDFPGCGCYGSPPGIESGNDGAGALAVYDTGSGATINVRDGLDLAFQSFVSPLDTTVPQTFTYPGSATARTGTLVNLVDSVESTDPSTPRPNVLRVSFDGGPATDYVNEFTSAAGPQWDSDSLAITIPANSTSMTVQVLSLTEDGSGNSPASLGWLTSALSVPTPPPPASLPLTPGYWKNHLAPVSATCKPKDGCSNNGPWTNSYLPISLGGYSVNTTAKVTDVFAAMNCASPTNCLAGHLLATKLNVANGSDTCISTTIGKADAFLSGGVADGVTGVTYIGPSGTYSLTSAQSTEALALKSKLDNYNNGGGC